jgi:hypothetical protein
MSKIHGTNIHVLPDENLGGVLREFIEVDRAANVGDKIVIVNPLDYQFGVKYTKGTVMTVTKADEDGDVYCGKFDLIDKDEYQTLEPTDIVRLREGRYRLVDRKAKVGEKVIVVYAHRTHAIKPDDIGNVFNVEDTVENHEYIEDCVIVRDECGIDCALYHEQYRVLEPVEPVEEDDDVLTVDETEASKSVIDLLANLAQRVTELERKLEREQEFRESLYRKISDMKDDIEMALDDIVTLDERTQPLATKKPSVAVAVRSIQQEFDGVFTKTEVDAYVAGEGFCLNGTFEFKGSVKDLNDAAEKVSEVFE